MSNLISTKNLIYLTLFLSPAYLIRFSILKIPFNLLDILILLIIFTWIYENKLSLVKTTKKTLKKISPILFPTSLILMGLFISAFLNNNLFKELGIIRSWFLLPIIFGFIVFDQLKTTSDFKKILNIIFFSSLLISVIGIFYFIFSNLTYDGRLSAFYLSPNHLAMIISSGLLIGFWNIFTDKKINPTKIILLLPLLITLYLTHSYGAWIAIFLSLFIILFFTRKKTILFFLILSFLFFIFEYDSNKFNQIFELKEKTSLTSRLVIWQSAGKILSDNWLWGIGAGNFQEKYLDYQKYFTPYPEWAVPQPHNLFLAFWLQTGLLGLIGFLYLIILWLIKIIKTLILTKDFYKKNIALILIVLLESTLIHGIIDTPYWKNDLALIFWTIIFLGLSLQNSSKLNKKFYLKRKSH